MSIPAAQPPARLPPARLPRAVIFDWDNTLVSNWRCVHAAVNAALVEFGMTPWTLEESYGRIRQSLRDSFPALFGAEWERARDIFYAYFDAHHIDYLDTLTGSAALLETLHGRGVYLAVVSNKTGRFLRREAAFLDWDRYFGALVGATDASVDKPDPAPVHMALAPGGLSAANGGWAVEDVWFVGDADIDMHCAHRAGCLPLLIGSTPHADDCLTEFPPSYHFADCLTLADLVKGL